MFVCGRVLRQRVLAAGPVLRGRRQQLRALPARRPLRTALRGSHRLRVPLRARLGRQELLAAGAGRGRGRGGRGRAPRGAHRRGRGAAGAGAGGRGAGGAGGAGAAQAGHARDLLPLGPGVLQPARRDDAARAQAAARGAPHLASQYRSLAHPTALCFTHPFIYKSHIQTHFK